VQFRQTELAGAYVISIDPINDERGFFARAWCRQEFEKRGLNGNLMQTNIGFSRRKGTLRGMHFQRAPFAECKLVRCTQGAVFDCIVDLRPDSPTYRRHFALELTAENRLQLYLPEGFAHGYQTLTDNSEVCYETTQVYDAASATGVRYDDPAWSIAWPEPVTLISESDRNWPLHNA
jgi:dTDP-4-dehydrorhamnose 3,5-epimerase